MNEIERHIQRLYPEHLGGYRNGWLEVKDFGYGVHIYSNNKILTTIIRGEGL